MIREQSEAIKVIVGCYMQYIVPDGIKQKIG